MAKQQIISTGGRKLSTPSAHKRTNIRQDSNRHKENLVGSKTSEGKQHKCADCQKTFAFPAKLKTHKRHHTGERPFQCQQCNKQFSQSSVLNRHLRTHSGEKPFKCGICDKQFSQSSDLNRHLRTHSGEKPFKCGVCDKQFGQSAYLQKHSRIHPGEKPFKCVKVVIVRHETVAIVRQKKVVRYKTMFVRRP
uniref:C2H2-type domain-containing protein n=1 Tax=Globodera rostochiensis TaxID=31243 RepID=A0A914I8W3_GLORO